MGRINISKSTYPTEKDVINVIYYDINSEKAVHYIHGANLILGDMPILSPESVAAQLIAVQNDHSSRIRRRIYHVGFDFDMDLDLHDKTTIYATGYALLYLYPRFQSMFVLHENRKNLHLHIIYNNIPLYKGGTLSDIINPLDMEYMTDYVQNECFTLRRKNMMSMTTIGQIVSEAVKTFIREQHSIR